MTVIQIQETALYVDIDKTKAYYRGNGVCDCPADRNLQVQIKQVFPKLDGFLSQMGIDICRPDEAADVEDGERIHYLFVGYTAVGHIQEELELDMDELHIKISKGETSSDWFPNEQTEPCFFVTITGIYLPWVLDKPFSTEKCKRLFKTRKAKKVR